MSKPCARWCKSVVVNWVLGWCKSNRAKLSGRGPVVSILCSKVGAAPFGVLASTVGAVMYVRAAMASKTPTLIIVDKARFLLVP